MKRKIRSILLSLCLMASVIIVNPAFAAGDWEITYSLTSNNKHVDYANTGDEVTVVFAIARTDLTDSWYFPPIYQAEIMYDEAFFEYVPDSVTVLTSGTSVLKQKREPGAHIIKITQMSPSFKGEMLLGSFKLKVIGTSGSGKIVSDREESYFFHENGTEIIPEYKDLEIIINDGNEFEVKVFDYVSGYRLVEVDGNATGYSFNGKEMLLSENYGGTRVWITNELQNYALDTAAEKAKELIRQSDIASLTVEDVGKNVNAHSVTDGKINFKDASAVHAVKNVWTAVKDENMVYFLNADVNADYTVNESDIDDVLGAYIPE